MSPKQQSASSIGYLLQHVASMLQRQADQVLQEQLGIGVSQFRILMTLERTPNIEQRKLADSLGQTEASISRQVKLLYQKGMLESHIDPAERRKHIVALTTRGTRLVIAAREVWEQYHAPLFNALGAKKEQAELHNALVLLHESVCAPGRPLACDQPFAIETIYDNQTG